MYLIILNIYTADKKSLPVVSIKSFCLLTHLVQKWETLSGFQHLLLTFIYVLVYGNGKKIKEAKCSAPFLIKKSNLTTYTVASFK